MSLSGILFGIGGFVMLILGGLIGQRLGKSAGITQGVEQASQTQQVEQAKATVQAVKERAHVETTVAADSDAELDARLSKHNRAD